MKKTIALILAITMMAALLAGCGSTKAETTDTTATAEQAEPATANEAVKTTFGLQPFEEPQTLRIGIIAGSQTAIPFLVAMGEGFFKELNIDVEMSSYASGPPMMEANADWDISAAGVAGNLVGSIGYDIPIIGVCDRETNQVLFARPDSPIANDPTNPEVYKGTTWLLPIGTTAHYALIKQLEALGLSWSDINAVNMDVSSAQTAFNGGEGDGVVLFNANVFAEEDAGYVRIADSGSLDATNSACLSVTPDALNNKRDLIVETWALFYLVADWCAEHPEEAAQYYLEHCEDEGVACTLDLAKRTTDVWDCPTLKNSIETMTEEHDDPMGLFTSRKLLQIEVEILNTMDFFISQDKYTAADREKFLGNAYVDNSICNDAVALLDSCGIAH